MLPGIPLPGKAGGEATAARPASCPNCPVIVPELAHVWAFACVAINLLLILL